MKGKILKRFEEEIAALERELKMELPKEIQRARELGDLRENAEYQAAKERQTLVNARIGMLKRRMNEIALMNMDRIPARQGGVRLHRHAARVDGPGDRLPARDARRRRRREGADLHVVADRPRHPQPRRRRRDRRSRRPRGARKFEIIKLVTIHDE